MVNWDIAADSAALFNGASKLVPVTDSWLSLRLLMTSGVSLLASLILGPFVIRWLRSRFGERIASDSARLNELHAAKKDTPTMGGILIVMTFLTALITQLKLSSHLVLIVVLGSLSLMAIGAFDDWIKLRTTRKGLSVRQKFAAQVVVSFLVAMALRRLNLTAGADHAATFMGALLPSSASWLYLPWATLVIVGTSNAVNLTDGLDGLATGCSAITGLALTVVFASLAMPSTGLSIHVEAATVCAALTGSAVGFLWFNRHPAKVFMGDAGSLPIGGILAISALACRIELALFLIGAVFVVETVSVIIQVAWYRRTRRRILLCSPLHNHFVFAGHREGRIVNGFLLAATIFAAAGVLIFS